MLIPALTARSLTYAILATDIGSNKPIDNGLRANTLLDTIDLTSRLMQYQVRFFDDVEEKDEETILLGPV